MESKNTLPIVKKRKKINIKKFVALAKKVRESFEEEAKYWEKREKQNADNNPYRFLLDS